MSSTFRLFDPLLGAREAEALLRLCERFGTYSTYADEGTATVDFAPELPQRFDAAHNFVRTGGRFGRREDAGLLASRTNYFRATYAYDGRETPGIEGFLFHEGLVEAAAAVHDRPVVVPNIVYANILVPGQELAVHTDVPEFRGANRMILPQWLLVVMHHSGLFDSWRMPIATAISYFGSCDGGALAYYPDGRDEPAHTLPAVHDTAIVLDTDTVFHGVDRVTETQPLPELRPGAQLRWGDDRWHAVANGETVATYAWDEVRFSVSWKAYCYADEADRRRTAAHTEDLDLETILGKLEADLRARGRLAGPRPGDKEWALRLVSEYVRFPASEAA